MKFTDYIRMALGNIWRQKLRSALTIFAVIIGATSVTIMLSLVTAAKSFFIKQVESSGMLQQIAVSSKQDIADFNEATYGNGNCDGCVKLTEDIVEKIKKVQHITGVTRILYAHQIQGLDVEGHKLSTNSIKGNDANGVITNNVLAGRDLNSNDKEGTIVITSDYADKLGYKGNYNGLIGKKGNLISMPGYSGVGADIPKPAQGPQQEIPPDQRPRTNLPATIVGVVDSSNGNQLILAPLSWVKDMNVNRMWQMTGTDQRNSEIRCIRAPCNVQPVMTLVTEDFLAREGYSSILAKVDNASNAKAAADEIKKFGVGASDAESMIKQQLTVFNVIGLILGGIGGIALIVAAIGVINTMIMAILERTREIGVMRAVGARRSTVRALFTFEASCLGFLGGAIGVAFGYGLTRIANIFLNKQLAEQGVRASDIITLPLWLILAVIGIATFIGFMAGLYPANRAARLNPVDALHYE